MEVTCAIEKIVRIMYWNVTAAYIAKTTLYGLQQYEGSSTQQDKERQKL